MVAKNRDDRFADTGELRAAITKALSAQDRSADKTEGYRVVGVIAATILVVGLLLFILNR
jgi:hypothetical protein